MSDTPISESSSSQSVPPPKTNVIRAGDTVLLRLPTGDVRSYKLEADSVVNLGKFGSFEANYLVDQPYGLTHEISDKKLKVVPPRTIEEVEDTEATNELINDGQYVQPLTAIEIETLKESGVHASDIIKKQIEMHANYSLKTEYSKDKYKKRKEAKYSKSFTTIEPTLFNVCEYWFKKDQNRIRDLRIDELSQMMNLANIRPGGRYLAVDDASGMVVSAILERLGGSGRLLTICDVDSPPAYPVMTQMNFSKELVAPVLLSLNWATADEEYIPVTIPAEPSSGPVKSDKQKVRLNKRKAVTDTLSNTREELFAGEFEGLIVATEYEPYSVIEKLTPYLAGSASIVVHSPHLQIVSDLQSKLRLRPQYLAPSVSESWLRRYQVLPGRTHPIMTTSGTGGYLLHTIKIYDDPSATPVVLHRPKVKKIVPSSTESNFDTPAPAGQASSLPDALDVTSESVSQDMQAES
ncbi:Gcd10p-domain-containing protein [Artomyces pyxidatus]|uniref:Gcd10p-domain-containing protein n=1 Tax=Artomyces pyxidatus TaxID=48021 RepID=A0ACB8SUU6_9AGAM|nr:Gcd10p-domain-containing protein [Artomyces pyxidatus]